MTTPRMMPGQEPYTPAELDTLHSLIHDAAEGDPGETNEPPSCADCAGRHPDYRSDFGHLDMDPTTGATILVQHREPRVMAHSLSGICATCRRPQSDHDARYDLLGNPLYYCLA